MFYFVSVIIVLFFFMLHIKGRDRSVHYIIFTMVCYTLALFSYSLYLAKDVFYYNSIKYFFSIPTPVWRWFMFLPISKDNIIRMMNMFCLMTIGGGSFYVLSFHPCSSERTERIIRITMITLMALEFIFYDPSVTRWLYFLVYPSYLSSEIFTEVMEALHIITVMINVLVVAGSMVVMFLCWKKALPFKIMKRSVGSISLCYFFIMLSYLFLFGSYPNILIKVSKIAQITTYLSAPIWNAPVITTLFPYYLIIAFFLICFSIYKSGQIKEQLESESFSLTKQISAADTTSKAFCHYIKNEMLAIQAELELLALEGSQKEAVGQIIDRCDMLYHQLDTLYRSTKTSVLTLTEINLTVYLQELMERFTNELAGNKVSCRFQRSTIMVLLDMTYFAQAVHNIISNALDAMAELPAGRGKISVEVSVLDCWVQITIADNGKGISQENLSQIFTPFFSTQPISKHWGIGLSLTYKIIEAHEGHISIDSREGCGTTVKIMLPCLK